MLGVLLSRPFPTNDVRRSVRRVQYVVAPTVVVFPVARRPKLPCRLAFEHVSLSCAIAATLKTSTTSAEAMKKRFMTNMFFLLCLQKNAVSFLVDRSPPQGFLCVEN